MAKSSSRLDMAVTKRPLNTMPNEPHYGPIESSDGISPTPEAREVTRLLMQLSEHQRGLVLCWFCKHCYRNMGPGDYCTCARDA